MTLSYAQEVSFSTVPASINVEFLTFCLLFELIKIYSLNQRNEKRPLGLKFSSCSFTRVRNWELSLNFPCGSPTLYYLIVATARSEWMIFVFTKWEIQNCLTLGRCVAGPSIICKSGCIVQYANTVQHLERNVNTGTIISEYKKNYNFASGT